MSQEENDAALEYISLMKPLLEMAGQVGIINSDTEEFTDDFQSLVASYPDTIQLHAACVLVIREWLRRSNQTIPDEMKRSLALFVFGTMLDARCHFIEDQYQTLLEELQRKGVLQRKAGRNDRR